MSVKFSQKYFIENLIFHIEKYKILIISLVYEKKKIVVQR